MLPDGAEADVPAELAQMWCRPASAEYVTQETFSPRSAACNPRGASAPRSPRKNPRLGAPMSTSCGGRYVYTSAQAAVHRHHRDPANMAAGCRCRLGDNSARPDRDRFGGGRHHSVDHDQLPDEPGQQHLDHAGSYTRSPRTARRPRRSAARAVTRGCPWTVTGTTPTFTIVASGDLSNA